MTTYTTIGSVRGSCGHTHRTYGGAMACLRRDQARCAAVGGYSDRHVASSDGSLEAEYETLTDDEQTERAVAEASDE